MSSKDDEEAVTAQLGRELRSAVTIESRCHLGLPVVAGVAPILDDGTPFPTRWWLTCPLARIRIDRLESAGGIAAMDRHLAADPGWQQRMQLAHDRYAKERDALVPADATHKPSGGVAGIQGEGLKCLHAHYADSRSGHDNPVGEAVAPFAEPLDCIQPCVIAAGETWAVNPEWRETR